MVEVKNYLAKCNIIIKKNPDNAGFLILKGDYPLF